MSIFPNPYLNGVTDWLSDGYSQNLYYGMIDWLKFAFLQVGAFQNVAISSPSGIYGGHPSILRAVKDPNYTDGQVWEASRADWVWETGVNYSTHPVKSSGVYVGSTYYPTTSTSGTYSHYINYPLGRVIFNSPIGINSIVKTQYASRTISVVKAKEPWFTELLYNSHKINYSDYISATGSYSQLGQARRQMPLVGVELVNRRGYSPFQIGGGQYVRQDILFTVLAENEDERNKIVDILSNQNDRVIGLPDYTKIKSSGTYPIDLDYRGSPVANPKEYEEIMEDFGWTRIRLIDVNAQHLQNFTSWLYKGVVRVTCEAIFEGI